MDTYLTLSQAADLLAELTNNQRIKDDVARIIMLGTEGKIPIYWRNNFIVTSISTCLDWRPKEELEPVPNSATAQPWLRMNEMMLSGITTVR